MGFVLAGLGIGLILGITGSGGGILATPILHFIGLPIHQATPIGLIAIAFSSLIGAINGLYNKVVRYKAAILMTSIALPFSFMGVSLSKQLPQRILLILFALVMVIVAIRIIKIKRKSSVVIARTNPNNGKFLWNTQTVFLLGLVGASAGFFSGLLGVGGGFVIVPLLKKFSDLSFKSIVATSLMVISLISIVSVGFTVSHGIHIPVDITLLFSSCALIGMLIGRKISIYIPERYIQYSFAILLIVISIILILRSNN